MSFVSFDAVILLPDTIELTLHADHFGAVARGQPWRSAGWLLAVRPDPWAQFHQFANWRLDSEGGLAVDWPIWTIADSEGTRMISQEIHGSPSIDGFVGHATRRLGAETVDSSAIVLSRSECPPEAYFHPDNWLSTLGR